MASGTGAHRGFHAAVASTLVGLGMLAASPGTGMSGDVVPIDRIKATWAIDLGW